MRKSLKTPAFFLLILSSILSIDPSYLEISTFDSSTSQETVILTQATLLPTYDYYSQLTTSCNIPKVQEDVESIISRSFIFYNKGSTPLELTINTTYEKTSLEINSENKGFITKEIEGNSNFPIEFLYDCTRKSQSNAAIWSIISIKIVIKEENLSKNYDLSYIKICQNTTLYRFDASFLILAALSMVIIFFAVRNQRITSLQKKIGFAIDWWMAFIYIFCEILFTLCWNYAQNVTLAIFMIFIVILSFFAIIFTLKEFFYYFKIFEFCNITINIPRFPISFLTIICALFSFCLVLTWKLSEYFIITDLLALFIVFASFKILKINSLKKGTIFLLIIGTYEILQEFVFKYWFESSIIRFTSSDFCFPLKFEIPNFGVFLTKRCSWLSVMTLIFPGLFLSYFHRYDSSKKIKVYFLMGYFGYLCGNGIWIFSSFIAAYSSPLLFYAFPFMIGFCSMLAYKRNENLELWQGIFYDYDRVCANVRKIKENKEVFEENSDAFHKEMLFEGLLDSSFESNREDEKIEERKVGEKKKEMEIFGGSQVIKSKIKVLEEMKFMPGMSISNKEELNLIMKNKAN